MLAWEQQPGESARAYEAFALYRDMGPDRSLAKVAQMLGKSKTLLSRWSSEHAWVDRVKALEARDEMLRREAAENALRQQAEELGEMEAEIRRNILEMRLLA